MKKVKINVVAVCFCLGILLLTGICQAEDVGNSVNNDGVAETCLTYSHGNELTGGESFGFSQGTYTGTGDTKVGASANAFVDLSGLSNECNQHPDKQQNAWSRAEINSSATKEKGDVSLSVKGDAQEGNWATLKMDDKNFSEGGNNFFISYSEKDPETNSCPPTPCTDTQNPNTISEQGIVFGWTTVQKTESGMVGETYGEGDVSLLDGTSGQTKIEGTGGIKVQSFKGEPSGNYSGARAIADFNIDINNPLAGKFGHAKGETTNTIGVTKYGKFGQATSKSYAETGSKSTE